MEEKNRGQDRKYADEKYGKIGQRVTGKQVDVPDHAKENSIMKFEVGKLGS